MAGERILVTSGGRFIGSHVARYLYLQGNYVRVVDIKFDDYIKERYYSGKLGLDSRVWENCLFATKARACGRRVNTNLSNYLITR